MLFRSSDAAKKSEKKNVAEVGWLLQTDHASFIWPDPAPVGRTAEVSEHAKALGFCPAVIDHEVRLFQVACPFDLRLKVRFNEKEEAVLVDVNGDKSSVVARSLANLASFSLRKQWRHPQRPLLQIRTPYVFVSDDTVFMTQLPPILHYREPQWPGILVGGRIPIHIWPRLLTWAFEWHDLDKELVLSRGEPWFYVRFETQSPGAHTRLVEAELTPELKQYLAGLNGVVNYVNGTFSLFNTARKRRPTRLLTKLQRT
jgi:hypothetical protein